MIEDAMLRHDPKHGYEELRAYIKRCRELRKKMEDAKTPEEVAEIEAELEEQHRAFRSEHRTETAVLHRE